MLTPYPEITDDARYKYAHKDGGKSGEEKEFKSAMRGLGK